MLLFLAPGFQASIPSRCEQIQFEATMIQKKSERRRSQGRFRDQRYLPRRCILPWEAIEVAIDHPPGRGGLESTS